VSERYADGEATAEQLDTAHSAAFAALEDLQETGDEYEYQTAAALMWAVAADPYRNQYATMRYGRVRESAWHVKRLANDVVGNPFYPVALDPAWRTEAVVGLVAGIYADRAFDRLPVLADALEDAGCADADVLTHCRGPGPHVRGCWVVDLLLGKT
jgi:hypothetical protein